MEEEIINEQIKVMEIKIFIDREFNLTGSADVNTKLFDVNKVNKTLNETIEKLYDCGKVEED